MICLYDSSNTSPRGMSSRQCPLWGWRHCSSARSTFILATKSRLYLGRQSLSISITAGSLGPGVLLLVLICRLVLLFCSTTVLLVLTLVVVTPLLTLTLLLMLLVGTEVGLTGVLLTTELLVSSLLGTLFDIVTPEVLASGDGPRLREVLLRLLLLEVRLLRVVLEILLVGTGLSLLVIVLGSLLLPVSITLVRFPSFLDLRDKQQNFIKTRSHSVYLTIFHQHSLSCQ